MREFSITEGQIKKLARCGAPALMHEWFPAAFEPEWEEIPLSRLNPFREPGFIPPVFLSVSAEYAFDYKIEDGKIFRKRS